MADNIIALGASSPEVKKLRDINTNKNKDSSFVCQGLWACEKLIQKNIPVTDFFFSEGHPLTKNEEKALENMKKYSTNCYSISDKTCDKISDRDGADHFYTIAQMPQYSLKDIEKIVQSSNNVLSMILDGQEQPGNMGAIIRSLDCAGGQFAIVTNQKVRLTHSRLIRSSLGAAFMMPLLSIPMEELIPWLEKMDFKLILTDLTAKEEYQNVDYSGRIAVIAGNEHTGISDQWRHCTNAHPVIIPMYGSCESLNVGFASTLVAYRAGIQQHQNTQKN